MSQEPKGAVIYETGFIHVTFDLVPDPAVAHAFPSFLDELPKTPLLDFTEQVWNEQDDDARSE